MLCNILSQIFIVKIIIIITLFKSLVVVAEHECSTNWEDFKPNKSNQMNKSNKANEIKLN